MTSTARGKMPGSPVCGPPCTVSVLRSARESSKVERRRTGLAGVGDTIREEQTAATVEQLLYERQSGVAEEVGLTGLLGKDASEAKVAGRKRSGRRTHAEDTVDRRILQLL